MSNNRTKRVKEQTEFPKYRMVESDPWAPSKETDEEFWLSLESLLDRQDSDIWGITVKSIHQFLLLWNREDVSDEIVAQTFYCVVELIFALTMLLDAMTAAEALEGNQKYDAIVCCVLESVNIIRRVQSTIKETVESISDWQISEIKEMPYEGGANFIPTDQKAVLLNDIRDLIWSKVYDR